jgi:1,4-dihydroxy-2-naphthoate octaprenyltransferase
MIQTSIVKWAKLGRAPFHSVGVLPFLLGNILAWRLEGTLSAPILVLGVTAVSLIMLTTYLNGEVFDRTEDRITQATFKNPFSGGSGLAVEGPLRRTVKIVSLASLAAAGLIGLVLQFGLQTGPWTIPLGCTGMVAGALYSVPPVRWASRGIGEILIGYCYGWLTVATGYYLQAGRIALVVLPIAAATACTIFNVILINEYPDHEGDRAAGKRNMAVRLGLEKAAFVYAAAAFAGVLLAFWSAVAFFPSFTWKAYVPVGLASTVAAIVVLRQGYRRREVLLALCGTTIVVNLATTTVFIAGALGS